MTILGILLGFIISLVISATIIYLAAKLLGEKEGFGTAVLASLIGTVLFGLISYFVGIFWIAALLGGIAWLIALGNLYSIGWLKSFAIAIVIWVFTLIVGLLLPASIITF